MSNSKSKLEHKANQSYVAQTMTRMAFRRNYK